MKPLIIGHRGAAGLLPENTLKSFALALEDLKADMVEFDIHLTRDGVPVILHDATLDRTTRGKGYINQKTLEEVKSLIPTFEELLARFPKSQLAVEIKESSPRIVRAVMDLIQKYKSEKRVIVGSKRHEVWTEMEKNYPKVRRFTSQVAFAKLFFEWRTSEKKGTGCNQSLSPFSNVVASIPIRNFCGRFDEKALIDFLHAKGIQVFFWTVNDPEEIRSLLDKGARAVITDVPLRMIQALSR